MHSSSGLPRFGQGMQFESTSYCLFCSGMEKLQDVLLTHGDSVTIVPNDLTVIAKYHDLVVGEFGLITLFSFFIHQRNLWAFFLGIAHVERKKYGVQFHPEVDLTVNGMQIFRNFLFKVACVRPNFLMTNREQDCLQYIRTHVKNKTVLVSFTLMTDAGRSIDWLIDRSASNHFILE